MVLFFNKARGFWLGFALLNPLNAVQKKNHYVRRMRSFDLSAALLTIRSILILLMVRALHRKTKESHQHCKEFVNRT